MTIHFNNPITADDLIVKAAQDRAAADAATELAASMAKFAEATGRTVWVVEAAFAELIDPAPISAPIKAPQDDAAQPPAASSQVSSTVEPERARAVLARPTGLVRAPAKSTVKPARPIAWDKLSLSERSIVLHLESLPDTFSPTQDLNIAQCVIGGEAVAVSLEMGLTTFQTVARWQAMWCSAVLEKKRTPTIDGQKRLLAALRYRAEVEG